MIAGLDSAYPPDGDQLRAAAAAGYGAWLGYFGGPNILNGWSDADFGRVRAAGLRTLAYCSGYSDPVALRARAEALAVPLCLDCEGGIRADGAWVEDWLVLAGAGLYGNAQVHHYAAAKFDILAAYPGIAVAASWPAYLPRPPRPCGWQYRGSHDFAGRTVDALNLEEGIFLLYGPRPEPGPQPLPGPVTRRIVEAMNGPKYHQFLMGETDPDGFRYLWTRHLEAGTLGPWRKVLNQTATGPHLGSDVIAAGYDEAGVLHVTVTGTDGMLYDLTSSDEGGSWTQGPAAGKGSGLLTIGV